MKYQRNWRQIVVLGVDWRQLAQSKCILFVDDWYWYYIDTIEKYLWSSTNIRIMLTWVNIILMLMLAQVHWYWWRHKTYASTCFVWNTETRNSHPMTHPSILIIVKRWNTINMMGGKPNNSKEEGQCWIQRNRYVYVLVLVFLLGVSTMFDTIFMCDSLRVRDA